MGNPAKLALARRLQKETTLTIRRIAECLSMGRWKSPNNKLYLLDKQQMQNKSVKLWCDPFPYDQPPDDPYVQQTKDIASYGLGKTLSKQNQLKDYKMDANHKKSAFNEFNWTWEPFHPR